MLRRMKPTSTPATRDLLLILERYAIHLIACGVVVVGLVSLVGCGGITGVALIAVGATAQLSSNSARQVLVCIQALVYLTLYFLFIGATFHDSADLGRIAIRVDLLLGTLVMALLAPLLARALAKQSTGL